jgi:hypothetical protein
MTNVTELRLRLRAAGFSPLPVEGKAPHMSGWAEKFETSDEEIRLWPKTWHLATNTGILAKFTPGADIDIMDEAAANAVEALAREHFEEHGDILVRFGLPPKRLIPLRTDEPFKKLVRLFVGPNGREHKIEILGDGQQWVAFGTHPDTGKPYGWHGGDLGTIKREDLPYVRREDMEKFLDAAAELLIREHGYQRAAERPTKARKGDGKDAGGADDWGYLVENIRAGCRLHDSLRELAGKLVASGMGTGAAINLLRGLMEKSTAPHDDRWRERYDDIPRAVESGDANARTPAQPFPFTMAKDITFEPKEFLIDGFLGRHEVSAWYGPPDAGKSTVLIHAACCVAAGLTFCGQRVRQGPVLYVAAERGAIVRRRIKAWCKEHGLDDIPLAVVDHAIDLRSNKLDAERIIATARELGGTTCGQPVAWIIFDTLNRVLAGGDENSSKDMGAVIAAIDHIHRATQAHVSVIHHVPVDRVDRMRGHGSALGAVDMTVRVTKEQGIVQIETDVAKDLVDNPCFAFTFKSVQLFADPKTGVDTTTAPVMIEIEGEAKPKPTTAKKLPKAGEDRAARPARGHRRARTGSACLQPHPA